MSYVNVRLRNPDIILIPITEDEKECLDEEDLYVLYKLPDSKQIQIGMLSPSMREYFPSTTNIWNLIYATSKAYFYNGGSELEAESSQITERPVYRVGPTDDRTVNEYTILNATDENNLSICLKDVIEGNYIVEKSSPSILRKTK
ncbi:MAG: hypothetical protein HFJ12_06995 [Bacilli bacterium]|nr:hypothetical protein [Bacilli bacterium]